MDDVESVAVVSSARAVWVDDRHGFVECGRTDYSSVCCCYSDLLVVVDCCVVVETTEVEVLDIAWPMCVTKDCTFSEWWAEAAIVSRDAVSVDGYCSVEEDVVACPVVSSSGASDAESVIVW